MSVYLKTTSSAPLGQNISGTPNPKKSVDELTKIFQKFILSPTLPFLTWQDLSESAFMIQQIQQSGSAAEMAKAANFPQMRKLLFDRVSAVQKDVIQFEKPLKEFTDEDRSDYPCLMEALQDGYLALCSLSQMGSQLRQDLVGKEGVVLSRNVQAMLTAPSAVFDALSSKEMRGKKSSIVDSSRMEIREEIAYAMSQQEHHNSQEKQNQLRLLLTNTPRELIEKLGLVNTFEVFTKNAVLMAARENQKSPEPQLDKEVTFQDLSKEEIDDFLTYNGTVKALVFLRENNTHLLCYLHRRPGKDRTAPDFDKTVIGFSFVLTLQHCLKYHPCAVEKLDTELMKTGLDGSWIIAFDEATKQYSIFQKVGKEVVKKETPRTFEEFHKLFPLTQSFFTGRSHVQGTQSSKESTEFKEQKGK